PAVDTWLGWIGNQPSQERHGIGERLAVLEGHKRDLVSGTNRTVPRAMFRYECAAAVALRKLLPGIKCELDRRHVSSEQHIGNDGPRNAFRMFLLHACIDVVADVAVRPAVESAVFQRRKVIGRKIVPETVAFIDCRPDLSCHRFQRQSQDRKSTRLNSSHEWISY